MMTCARLILVGLMAFSGALQPLAIAQQPERLARSAATQMDADGKLVASPSATVGNMVVDAYAGIGEKAAAAGDSRDMLLKAYEPSMCSASGIGRIAGHAAEQVIKAASFEQRVLWKVRDPDSLSAMSMAIIADLDGVTPEAIQADEALGPGAYHWAIAGMSLALDRCDFFGLGQGL